MLDLIFEQSELSLVELWIVVSEDLEGVLVTLLICSVLDLGREAGAESSADCVAFESGWHLL